MRILFDISGLSQLVRRLKFLLTVMNGLLSGRIHSSVRLGQNTMINGQGEIWIGKNTSFRSNVFINLERGSSLRMGQSVEVGYGVRISVPAGRQMTIGDGVRLNQGSVLSGEVAINSNCILAAHTYIVSDAHNFRDPTISVDENDRQHGMKKYCIKLNEGVFVGAYAKIFGPAHLGTRSIVGAGVMMSGDLPDEHLIKLKYPQIVETSPRKRPEDAPEILSMHTIQYE